ncbi:tigger transposable element-derived protein 6 [Plakobranchus ocellatus]|uniref:Tigger transposable element-derived protein 6 n=1 Tax=Plakobranchus ocellatus TaxID=259542 RepID=A0AAV4BGJ5_9GAST|nr:tigger transposable element-derived protein 6 [Plakobranchus ocellatus]
MSVTEIVNSISGTEKPESEQDDCEIIPVAKVSNIETKEALKKLMQYAQQHEQGVKLIFILMSAEDEVDELAC